MEAIRTHTAKGVESTWEQPMRLARRLGEARRRSEQEYGLDPCYVPQENVLPANRLAELKEQEDRFLRIAGPYLDWLHRNIGGLGYCTLLTDKVGATLEQRSVDRFAKNFTQNGLRLGACWSEATQGACGIGTAIVDRMPIMVVELEHFLIRNHGISCCAVPLFGPEEDLLGILNTTAFTEQADKKSQMFAYSMATQAAMNIEQAYFFDKFKNAWVMKLQDDLIGVETEAMLLLAFDEDGKILGMSNQAKHQLVENASNQALNLEQLLEISPTNLIRFAHDFPGQPISFPLVKNLHGLAATLRAPRRTAKPVVRAALQSAAPGFANLAVDDPMLVESISRLKLLANNKIPIMMLGETGTGKESFAKAIHDYSERRDKPFIAINCAAIPETLIESELFGYKEGAFTGALAKGSQGKIAMAHGGTLFLDEIGDMPLLLQTRLLRVLAEGELLALGATTPKRVDISVICATHRNLPEMVKQKMFREDLFYRLNAATFRLPPLRERSDINDVVNKVFTEEITLAGRLIALSHEARQVLLAYRWPGNIRELRNVLKFAIAVCTDDEVTPEHLPESVGFRESQCVVEAPMHEARPAINPRNGVNVNDEEIINALDRAKGNKSAACRLLRISRATLYRKLKNQNN